MKQTELAHLLSAIAIQRAERVLSVSNCRKVMLIRADAYRLYGRTNVDRWIAEGLLQTAVLSGKASKQLLKELHWSGLPLPATELPICQW